MKQTAKKILGFSCVVIALSFLVASLSLVKGSSVATITVGGSPYDIAFTPDGKYAYVTNDLANVSVIDTATNKVVAGVASENGMGIVITPDGKYAYVTHADADMSVISTATNTVVDNITVGDPSVGNSPNGGIAITHDGKYVYATMPDSVAVISTATNRVTANITITPRNSNANVNGVTLFSYSDPVAVAISPDDKYAYVGTGMGDDRIIVINISTNKIVNSTTLGSEIEDLAITPDGNYLYATTGDDKIFVINAATDTVTTTLTGFGSPYGIAITSDGKYAYTENNWNDTVFVLNTATDTVERTVSVAQAPRELAFTPDGQCAYVVCDTQTPLTGKPGADYVGKVSVISTGENSTSPQATPVAEFPAQFLAAASLFVVLAVSASVILVKQRRVASIRCRFRTLTEIKGAIKE